MRFIYFLILLAVISSCGLKTGSQVPEFDATTMDGSAFSSENLKGKITVIKVWATWCGPCVSEIPQSNALAEKFSDNPNIQFIAVTDESREKVKNFLSKKPFLYQQIVNDKALKDKLQPRVVQTIPEYFIINQKGEIVYNHSNTLPDMEAVLSSEISKLLSRDT